MTLRQLGLGVLGWFLASCLYGQFTLSGTVTDTRGQILPGAAVLVEENIRLGVTTDRDGQFSIFFPSEGPWTVKASFVGHSSETERITFQRPNTTLRFKLTPGTNLGEAEVVGDGPKDVTVQRIEVTEEHDERILRFALASLRMLSDGSLPRLKAVFHTRSPARMLTYHQREHKAAEEP